MIYCNNNMYVYVILITLYIREYCLDIVYHLLFLLCFRVSLLLPILIIFSYCT